MVTSNQRDVLAGIMTLYVMNRAEGLTTTDIVQIYETNREEVEDYVVGQCERGREESLARME